MFGASRPRLTKPGLFVTSTDTGVGKTMVACAIVSALREEGHRVGVCKPFASGCRTDRHGLINEDAEALARCSGCPESMRVINPIRYKQALAPAVAARQSGSPPDGEQLVSSIEMLDAVSDILLFEGVGGVLVPLDEGHTVLDLIAWLGYPVVVVTRATLGTLNHTAMTVGLLRQRQCPIAGLIVNHLPSNAPDPSVASNCLWLEEMNQTPILANVPACNENDVALGKGQIPAAILQAVASTRWLDQFALPRERGSSR